MLSLLIQSALFINSQINQQIDMSQIRGEKIDSDSIRKGLMSIRNSQIELLNELKIETQQLKNAPLVFNTSTEDSYSQRNHKNDHNFTFPPENTESMVKYNPPSPSTVDKPFSFGLPSQNQLQNEIIRLKEENKSLNQSVQKLLYSRSMDKQRIRQLESYLYFNSKIHYQILSQIFSGTPLSEVKRGFENDLKMNEDIYNKYQQSNHRLVLQLLQERQTEEQKRTVSGTNPSPRQTQITSQLGELKDQLVMLLKTNQKDTHVNSGINSDFNRLKQQCQVLRKKCEEMQDTITQLNSDNKQLALCWEREISERKSLIKEFEKKKKDNSANRELEKQFSFVQTDLEAQLVQAQDIIKQRDDKIENLNGQFKTLRSDISKLKDQNEQLKRQAIEAVKLRDALKEQNLQASKSRSRENQAVLRMSQQSSMLSHYERQNTELKNHLADLRVQFQVLARAQYRQRQTQALNQEMFLRKTQMMKTTTTVEHLWQVKRVEFENINELLRELKDKNAKGQ